MFTCHLKQYLFKTVLIFWIDNYLQIPLLFFNKISSIEEIKTINVLKGNLFTFNFKYVVVKYFQPDIFGPIG